VKVIKKTVYSWISAKDVEPFSVCILDIEFYDTESRREAYPAYKNPHCNDEWYILFTQIPLASVVGKDFKIVNWMPFPEPDNE
jgi:hypothetical protein